MTQPGFDKYVRCGAYHWDALSPSLRAHNAITAARYRQVLLVCGPLAGRTVLDVGCGDAKLDALLAEAGARLVIGVDNERTGLDAGRARMEWETSAAARQRIALGCVDGYRLPIRAGSCDLVVMTDIIEHVPDALAFVREAATALRADGMLVVTTPYRITEVSLEASHVHEFFPGELTQLLRHVFCDVSIRLSDPVWAVQLYTMDGWARPFRWLVNGLSILAKTNVFLTWPVGRYAAQITAIACGPIR